MHKCDDSSTRLSIQIMGSVRVSTDNGELISLPIKATALLVYFALSGKSSETKEFIKGLLWSESSQKHASGSLRQCLKKLNDSFSLIDFGGFDSNGRDICLNSDLLRVDIIELHELLQRDHIPVEVNVENINVESLLNDLDVQDQAFDTWVHVQRRNWLVRLTNVLENCISAEVNTHNSGLDHARLLYALDPTHEEACRFIMRVYASRENLGPVMEIYSKLCAELNDKYGAEPSSETVELYISIQSGNYCNGVAPADDHPPITNTNNTPVIGINEFHWSGESTEKETMHATFFRNEMMAALSKFREWVVVDTRKRHQPDPDTLDVDYVLDGTCYQVENFTDVLITLADSATGQIWSETLRIETKTWTSSQRLMVSKISVALNVYLSTARLTNTISQQGLASSEHELWQEGYQSMLAWDPESDQKAEMSFRSIIERSPLFAPAYSSLATVLNTRHFKYIGKDRASADAKMALYYAQKGVELDPLESRTQLALGFSLAMNGQFEQAQLHLSLARELNPYSPVSVVPCAHGLSYCGLHTVAVELVDWAENVNWQWMPRFHWGYILCVRFLAGDFEKAIYAAKLADGVIVDLHAWHAAALAMDGQIDAAANKMQTFVNLARENWQGHDAPDSNTISRWFLGSFPFRREEDLDLIREGLTRAGLTCAAPVSKLTAM